MFLSPSTRSVPAIASVLLLALVTRNVTAQTPQTQTPQTQTPQIQVPQTQTPEQQGPAKQTPVTFDAKAAALLDGYVKATGGEKAYDAIQTRVLKGELSVPARSIQGSLVTLLTRSNVFYSEIRTQNVMQRRGSNGKTVWMIEPAHGPRILTGLERVLVVRDSTLDRFGHWRELASKVEYAGEEELDGKKYAKVVMTYRPFDPQAKESPITIYFDSTTGLIGRFTTVMRRPDIHNEVTALLDDYQKTDGILLARKMVLKMGDWESVVKVTSVENNVQFDPRQFELPREIQELLVRGK